MLPTDPPRDSPPVLPLAEERLAVGTRRVVTGHVRLTIETGTEEVPVTARLSGETVEVTRVPVNREVASRPDPRVEGDVTIYPVLEEVLVVERRLMLREEIHLRRIHAVETVDLSVPLRRQQAVIRRDGTDPRPHPVQPKETR